LEHQPLNLSLGEDAFRPGPASHPALKAEEFLLGPPSLVGCDHLAKELALAPALPLGKALIFLS